MRHLAVFYQTRLGRAGCVMSGDTFSKMERALDGAQRAHKTKSGNGLVGYVGCETFEEAVRKAAAWEDAREGSCAR